MAFSGIFNRFLLSDLTLSIKAICNLEQKAASTSVGLTYMSLNNFLASLSVVNYFGKGTTEYTLNEQVSDIQLSVGLRF